MNWELIKRNDSDKSLDFFKSDIDRFFDDFFSVGSLTLFESDLFPKIDIEDDEKAVHIKAEIPGIEEKDLNVELNNRCLTISGEKKDVRKEEDKKKNSVVSERRFGSFSRTITIPEGTKVDEIKASYKNGVLNIELPKSEKVMPKKIEINVH